LPGCTNVREILASRRIQLLEFAFLAVCFAVALSFVVKARAPVSDPKVYAQRATVHSADYVPPHNSTRRKLGESAQDGVPAVSERSGGTLQVLALLVKSRSRRIGQELIRLCQSAISTFHNQFKPALSRKVRSAVLRPLRALRYTADNFAPDLTLGSSVDGRPVVLLGAEQAGWALIGVAGVLLALILWAVSVNFIESWRNTRPSRWHAFRYAQRRG